MVPGTFVVVFFRFVLSVCCFRRAVPGKDQLVFRFDTGKLAHFSLISHLPVSTTHVLCLFACLSLARRLFLVFVGLFDEEIRHDEMRLIFVCSCTLQCTRIVCDCAGCLDRLPCIKRGKRRRRRKRKEELGILENEMERTKQSKWPG